MKILYSNSLQSKTVCILTKYTVSESSAPEMAMYCITIHYSNPSPHPLMRAGLKSLLQQSSSGGLTLFSLTFTLPGSSVSLSLVCHLLHGKLQMHTNPLGVMLHTWGQWLPGHLQLAKRVCSHCYKCSFLSAAVCGLVFFWYYQQESSQRFWHIMQNDFRSWLHKKIRHFF